VSRVDKREVAETAGAVSPAGQSRLLIAVVLAFVAFNVALAVVVTLVLGHVAHRDPAPVFTPSLPVSCPDGQHVTGAGASGQPDCATDN
jgi:hypothetical protein